MTKIKIIITFIYILLLCSCGIKQEYKSNTKTIIEQNTNNLIAINYPLTNIKKIDKQTKNYVNKIYNDFLKQYSKINYPNKKYELNIDYEYYNFADNYISIILYTHINTSNDELILNDIYNYVYNLKTNQQISITEFIDNNTKNLIFNLLFENYGNLISMEKITNINYDTLNFVITDNNLKIIFKGDDICDNYHENLDINIPIEYFQELKKIKPNNQKIINNIKPTINYIDINKKVVALTFDDGPSIYTNEILKTLEQYNCNATFFVLGNKITNHSETIQEMYKKGNEIGNHSYNHRWLTRLSKEEQTEQIKKTQEIIETYTGFTPKYLRPTYGSINQSLRNNTDLEIVLWNVDTKDWKYKKVDTIVNNALKDVKDGSIILMHDTYERTSEAVKILIPKLIENGYQLVTISELQEIKKLRKITDEIR